ncbi:hypothetical protein T484DRAFT_1821343 [Baffinella frigidus]|nr:hypothetical protein T484DRAFT_1821343 [Cryptophyta sp. CCMP2293]
MADKRPEEALALGAALPARNFHTHSAALGKGLRQDAKPAGEYLEEMADKRPEEALALGAALLASGSATIRVPAGYSGGEEKLVEVTSEMASVPAGYSGGEEKLVEVTSEMVSFEKTTRTEHGATFVPAVVEPSFGIDRILYTLLEAAFYTRPGDAQRTVLAIPPALAPFKCAVLPLTSSHGLPEAALRLSAALRVDDSGAAIGRR